MLESCRLLRRSLEADPADTLARGWFVFGAAVLGQPHLARPVADDLRRFARNHRVSEVATAYRIGRRYRFRCVVSRENAYMSKVGPGATLRLR